MSFKDWWYKSWYQRMWPKTINILFSFKGKGSDDSLYCIYKNIPFDKPLELKYVKKEYDSDWRIDGIIREDYVQLILELCKRELLAARQEQLITLDSEERITGDYIVAVDGRASIGEWRELSRDEWLMLKAMEEV